MQARTTEQIAELTLTWINEQLRAEAVRLIFAEEAPPPPSLDWRGHAIAAISGMLIGLCLVLTTFAV